MIDYSKMPVERRVKMLIKNMDQIPSSESSDNGTSSSNSSQKPPKSGFLRRVETQANLNVPSSGPAL